MRDRKLPAELEDFFRRTQEVQTERREPAWLKSSFEDELWLINGGANSRLVDGELKGTINIKWSKCLSSGKLTDACYKTVAHHAKIILILAFDGAIPRFSGSLKTISGFYGFLFRLIEYLDFVYGESFKDVGFEILDAEAVTEFLELSMESGVCGTGFFIERWEKYLTLAGSSPTDLETAKNYLRKVGAFDSRGNVSLLFVEDAIGADASRLGNSRFFKDYMRRYSLVSSSGFSNPIQDKTTSQLANWFGSLALVLSSSSISTSPDFDDPYSFNESLKPFRGMAVNRTRSLPFAISKKLINGCCVWMWEVFPELDRYIRDVISVARDIRQKSFRVSDFTALKLAEDKVCRPSQLEQYHAFFFGGEAPLVSRHSVAPSLVMKLIQLQMSISFVLIALLSCSRRAEVIELCENDVFEVLDRSYLHIRLRKTGSNFDRATLSKPVPRLVNYAIEQLLTLKAILSSYYVSTDPLFETRLFFKVTQMGIGPFLKNDIYIPLRSLSEFLDLRDSDGARWDITPHQLRRSFALSFYHNEGVENSLPALSWFMGHGDIEGTWRYVKECLTGKEISASEAAMAASAVCSDDKSQGAERLREILMEHFGCSDLSLMREEEVQDYLELLSERGVYTATPITIRSGRNKIFSVLIVIAETNNGPAS